MSQCILLVEDDQSLGQQVSRYLRRAGHSVVVASDLAAARLSTQTEDPSLVILDLGLPDGHGLDLLDDVRNGESMTPIIVVTGATSESEELMAFQAGVNDFVRKPFSFPVLAERVRTWLNIKEAIDPLPMEFDAVSRRLHAGNVSVTFTPVQSRLFVHLSRNPLRTVLRAELLHVWPESCRPKRRTVDHHVWAIRSKLNILNAEGYLQTARGGYIWSGKVKLQNASLGKT